jgi:hypothetical protein
MQRSTARSAILDLRPFSPFLIGRPFDFIHAFSSGAACLSVQAELTRTKRLLALAEDVIHRACNGQGRAALTKRLIRPTASGKHGTVRGVGR